MSILNTGIYIIERNATFNLYVLRRAQVKVGLRLERRYSQR